MACVGGLSTSGALGTPVGLALALTLVCACRDGGDGDGDMIDTDASGDIGTEAGTDDVAEATTDASDTTDDESGTNDGTTTAGTTGPDGACADGMAEPGEACYGAAVDLEVGVAMAAVAIGDVNGDGHLDVVAGTATDVRLHLGDGDGGFEPATPAPVSAPVLALLAVDVSRDGAAEVFAAIDAGEVALFAGGGTTLQDPKLLTVGDEPSALVLAPLDADATLDLAVANAGDGNVSLLAGDGSGDFADWTSLEVGGRPSSIAAADLPGSDAMDLAVADGSSDVVAVLRNAGTGFDAPVSHGVGLNPDWVGLADFDGDGELDIGTVNEGSESFVWLPGLDNGSFDAPQSIGLGASPRAGATGDLDGDGTMDVAAVSRIDDTVELLLSDGVGDYYPAQSTAVPPGPRAIAAGDLNEDGVTDLAVASLHPNGGLAVLLSDI